MSLKNYVNRSDLFRELVCYVLFNGENFRECCWAARLIMYLQMDCRKEFEFNEWFLSRKSECMVIHSRVM